MVRGNGFKPIMTLQTSQSKSKLFGAKVFLADVDKNTGQMSPQNVEDCCKKFKIKKIVRITSDCPLIDYRILDQMIKIFKKKRIDYYANALPLPCKFPDGMDIEIFTFKTLKETFKKALLPSEKEHVTNYMWKKNNFKILKKNINNDLSKYRFTIDYKKDFVFFCKLIDKFGINKIHTVSMNDLINFVKKNQYLVEYQKKIKRNQGWKSSLIKDKKFFLNLKK